MNIVITGASRGIGLAEANLLNKPENHLFLVATSKDSFKDIDTSNATLIEANLTDNAGIKKVAATIRAEADHIDLLVNNVGVMIMKKFEDLSDEEIDQLLDTNLRAHILLTKSLLPLLLTSKTPQIILCPQWQPRLTWLEKVSTLPQKAALPPSPMYSGVSSWGKYGLVQYTPGA